MVDSSVGVGDLERRAHCRCEAERPMRNAIFVPPFGELSDPVALSELGRLAEAQGWDGMFLWDHILRPAHEPQEIADPWIALAAIACATSRLRLGPMVTPLSRRRPHIVARQSVTLDRLSGGRLTLGVGLGVDTSGELSKFAETVDPVERGRMLDEAADLLVRLWSGATVEHHGDHFRADDVRFLPRPVQEPRIELWVAARARARAPVRRAARLDGMFAIDVDLEGLREMVARVEEDRGGLEDFEVAALAGTGLPGLSDLEKAGVTWAMWEFAPGTTVKEIEDRVRGGP